MKFFLSKLLFLIILFPIYLEAQVINSATLDTNAIKKKGVVTLSGMIDTYYLYDFGNPPNKDRQFTFANSRNNEFTINLAYIDIKYISERLRGRVVPGFGTYMNANYIDEPTTLKNFVEANIGVKIFAKKNIWVDAGILGSPYTPESAISKDQIMYTRSMGTDLVPYYLSGVKLSAQLAPKLMGYFYLLNGWQNIKETNDAKSVGTQLEYRPNDKLLLNWNTYTGDDRTDTSPTKRMRFFNDFYVIYSPNDKFTFTSCAYLGFQQYTDIDTKVWWQANAICKYNITKKTNVAARIEYFSDKRGEYIGSNVFSTSASFNIGVLDNVLIRFEGRFYSAEDKIYQRTNRNNGSLDGFLTSNMTVWF